MNTTYRPATVPMAKLLYRLMAERSTYAANLAPYDEFMATMEHEVAAKGPQAEFGFISRMITEIKNTPADKPSATLPDVPAGYYALVHPTENKIYFFKVDRPTEGKWAGYTFVKRVSGDNELRVDRADVPHILRMIAANPLEAAMRYGRETTTCGMCNTRLTDKKSRDLGIGPNCIKNHFGITQAQAIKSGKF